MIITFSQLAQIWMEQYHPTESAKWIYQQQFTIDHHLLPSLGSMYARTLKQVHLQSIIKEKVNPRKHIVFGGVASLARLERATFRLGAEPINDKSLYMGLF